MKLKRQLLVLLALCLAIVANAQITQGLKLPQLTTTQRDLIQKQGDPNNPYADGQVIYNLDNDCLEFWNGTEWVSKCASPCPTIASADISPNTTQTKELDPLNVFKAGNNTVFVADAAGANAYEWWVNGTKEQDGASATYNLTMPAVPATYSVYYIAKNDCGADPATSPTVQVKVVKDNEPDLSGNYRISGKVCYDVKRTDHTGDVCMPLTSRTDDFLATKTFTYTFNSPTGSAYYDLELSVSPEDLIADASQSGNLLQITFKNDVNDLAEGTTKVDAKKIKIKAKYEDAGHNPKQVELEASIQDCSCGCTVDKAGGGTLTFMCYNLGVPESTKLLSPQEQADTYSPTYSDYSASAPDSTIYGALYQWGRKSDGHQMRTSPTYSTPLNAATAGNLDANGQVLLSGAVGRFIIGASTQPYDWRYNPQDNKLWDLNENDMSSNNPSKSANDPCPDGWRVPTYGEWNAMRTVNTRVFQGAGAGKTAGLLFTPTGASQPTLFLPAAGLRSNENGTFAGVGTAGEYWSSSTSMTIVHVLRLDTASPTMNGGERAWGCSVRCVSDY